MTLARTSRLVLQLAFSTLALNSCTAPPAVTGPPRARPTTNGYELVSGRDGLRVVLTGTPQHGFQVTFDRRTGSEWTRIAGFVPGEVWAVYSRWEDSWYARPAHFAPSRVEVLGEGKLRATARGEVDGQQWAFSDVYGIECGLVRIDRTFEHLDSDAQSPVTLQTRLRVPMGGDPRLVIPANSYNNNPSMLPNLPGPRMSEGYVPGALAAYEEHRLPIPFVNVESDIGGRRTGASLMAVPGKIAQGHKGMDHWWSLGVQWGAGHVDLLSLSGPVATNGKRSQVYGHRNAFDPYDDAYLDVRGRVAFRKTLYVDPQRDVRTGYAFRETLWKAFEVFHPVEAPHIPFREAMQLKKVFAEKRFFYTNEHGAAGHAIWAGQKHIQYGWVGGALATACGLLYDSGITGDLEAKRQALASIDFFVHKAPARTPGLFLCEYFGAEDTWKLSPFHGGGEGIPSRQFSETLNHLSECILVGREQGLDTGAWEKKLLDGCNFLVRTPRYKGLLPRGWTADGKAMEWTGDEKYRYSTAGAYAIEPLVKAYRFSEDTKYLEAAVSMLEAYYRRFGENLAEPFWGGTNDAGCEDKEAGWPVLAGALALHEATGEKRYLQWARDAADWTLTWMYFHDIDLPADPVLDKAMNTVGWTFISLHNQEIDVFGYWMAADYYQLGRLTGDDRYLRIARMLFYASTQTIARPGAMLGLPDAGLQSEHYNHTNCTYVPDGRWRGQQHSVGIGWVWGSQMLGGTRLARLDPLEFSLRPHPVPAARPEAQAPRRRIRVDGKTSDWKGIEPHLVAGEEHLWFGQNMTREKWRGDRDLSFRWRSAWSEQKLYFLFEVSDDKLVDPPRQPNSFLNDCIEILLDPRSRGGRRFVQEDGRKTLRGYEMHFLPSSPPLVFLDDALSPMYPMDSPQNEIFQKSWSGEVRAEKTPDGYLMEIGFSIPGVTLEAGTTLGLDVDVCDDDGDGRKALQIWTGKQVDFWITMDHYGRVTLVQ